MKSILSTLLFFLFSLFVNAQSKALSGHELVFQSRLLHQPSGFKTVTDFGVVTRWDYKKLHQGFSFNFGLGINYSTFKRENAINQGTLYVDYFKKSRKDYIVFQEVRQLNLELPFNLIRPFLSLEKGNLSFISGITPQFLLYSNAKGIRFNNPVAINTSITGGNLVINGGMGKDESHQLLNDVFLNFGLHHTHGLKNEKSVIIETGFEYSTMGKSAGMFIRAGISF